MSDRNRKTAAEEAYAYLAARMRTRAEVERRLKNRGYESGEIAEALSELDSLGYIDDYQYALRYYEYNREKRRGSGRAARELAEKGLDPEVIRNAREDFLYSEKVDEYADALEAAEKEVLLRAGSGIAEGGDSEETPLASVMDERLSAKIARKLDGKGFDRGDIYRVLEELRRRYGSCE